jgi:DNA repair protein RecO (recombination protein O)
VEEKLEALIIRTLDYQEHSQLVYFYTPMGIKSALARGVKKMSSALRPYIQTGNHLLLTLSKGKLPTIKQAEKIDLFPSVKSDLIKMTLLSVVLETLNLTVSKEDDHPKLFQFIIKWINTLKMSDNPLELSLIFDLKMLYFLGYGLQFKTCHVCHSETGLYLDMFTGMVSCKAHTDFSHQTLDEEAFKPLHYYLYVDILDYSPLTLSKETFVRLMQLLDQLFKDQVGIARKSKKILYPLL